MSFVGLFRIGVLVEKHPKHVNFERSV